MSRSIVWGLARQQGIDPTRWRSGGDKLVPWGGETFNTLLAAFLARQFPGHFFIPSSEEIAGPASTLDVSASG